MLVLTQTKKESIVLRDETGKFLCEIKIGDIRGFKTILLFNAIPEIKINRKNVDERKYGTLK